MSVRLAQHPFQQPTFPQATTKAAQGAPSPSKAAQRAPSPPSPLVHASPTRPTLHLHKPARHLEAGGTGYTPLVNSMDFCCEAIRNLPPELREKILNELIATKIRERVSLGWSRANFQNLLAAVKIRERNALGWKELHNEFCLKVLEPDWEELERIRDEQYEIVLGEAIEQNVPLIVCHFCQRPQSPISFCNCKRKKKGAAR